MDPTRPTPGPTATLDEGGTALPYTIFLITIITVLLAAVFTRIGAEHQISFSASAQVSVLGVARSGLENYMASVTARPTTNDSVRINVVGGYAWVVPVEMQIPVDPTQPTLYIVRSSGYLITPAFGDTALARRTVAQFARWIPPSGTAGGVAAHTAINDIDREDPPGTEAASDLIIDGNDQCVPAAPPITGLRGPSTLMFEGPQVTGAPNTDLTGTSNDVYVSTNIDWDAVVNGDPSLYLTTPIDNDPSFLTYRVTGDFSPSDFSGTGLLAVTGDLHTQGNSFLWEGLVLVGGRLRVDSDFTEIRGKLVTGLNEVYAPMPPVQRNDYDDVGERVEVYYNSCFVRNALTPFFGFRAIDDAAVDSWALY